MLKKGWPILFVFLFLMPSIQRVSAEDYSPHYLPGGKNYLCNDNFEYDVDQVVTIEPFTVKANAYYTFGLPRGLYDPGEVSISMTFFSNTMMLESMVISSVDFDIQMEEPWYAFYTFQLPATANYMTVSISDNNNYLLTNGVLGLMLEEGASFTGYEPYIEGSLIDVNGPYYQGEGIIIVNIDDAYTLEEITQQIHVIDAIDGDVSSSLIVQSDQYSSHSNQVGTYEIGYSVSDSSGNETTFELTVKVVDITNPVITGPTEISVIYPNVLTLEDILAQFHASDNVDGDISSSLIVTSEDYTENSSLLGFYTVSLSIVDSSENQSEHTVEIVLVDQTYPSFTGPDQFTIGYDSNLSMEYILSSQSVMDDYDLDLSSQIVIELDQFTPNKRDIGLYPIVLSAVDSSGNKTEKTIEIRVTDSIGPVVYLDTSIIMIYNQSILSLSDFAGILIQSGELMSGINYRVQTLFDSYSDHSTIPGVYHLKLEYQDNDGNIALSKAFEIVVQEKNNYSDISFPDTLIDTEKPEQKFIQKYWLYFAGGGIFILALISNVIWFCVYRKK